MENLLKEYAEQIKELNEKLSKSKKTFSSVSEKLKLAIDILEDAIDEIERK